MDSDYIPMALRGRTQLICFYNLTGLNKIKISLEREILNQNLVINRSHQ
jgi:hypothetical protein